MFDADFYRRYYLDPRTRVAGPEDALRLGGFVCAAVAYLGFRVRRVLDAGCGLGHMQPAVTAAFPKAKYVGLEASQYLCDRHGWVHGSLADYAPRAPFDLVICHDVLQYLPDREASRALSNLRRLCRGALYLSVFTAEDRRQNADRRRSDAEVHLRPADWYRQRLDRAFSPLGLGLYACRGCRPVLWELERPPAAPAARRSRRRPN